MRTVPNVSTATLQAAQKAGVYAMLTMLRRMDEKGLGGEARARSATLEDCWVEVNAGWEPEEDLGTRKTTDLSKSMPEAEELQGLYGYQGGLLCDGRCVGTLPRLGRGGDYRTPRPRARGGVGELQEAVSSALGVQADTECGFYHRVGAEVVSF